MKVSYFALKVHQPYIIQENADLHFPSEWYGQALVPGILDQYHPLVLFSFV